MNWDDLKIVLAISRTQSLRAAARKIGIDQSTVSRRLAAIEAALGVILFVRSKSGFRTTHAGDIAIARARDVENLALDLEEQIQVAQHRPAGQVRVVTNFWLISQFLAPNLPRLNARYPELQLRAIGETRGRSLSRREAELGLGFDVPARQPEIKMPIGDIPYAVFHRRDREARGLDWVSFWDDDIDRAPMRWLEETRRAGETMRMTANDASAVTAAVRSGVGKGLIPICLGEQHQELVRLDPEQPDLVRPLYASVHPDMMQSARIRATLSWLKEIFENPEHAAVP